MYKALPEVVDGDRTSFTSESLHWPRISVEDEHLPMGKKKKPGKFKFSVLFLPGRENDDWQLAFAETQGKPL